MNKKDNKKSGDSLAMNEELNEGKFNIKKNMKASYGVVFQEGKNYIDQGEEYNVGLNKEEGGVTQSIRLSLNQYAEKHQKSIAI